VLPRFEPRVDAEVNRAVHHGVAHLRSRAFPQGELDPRRVDREVAHERRQEERAEGVVAADDEPAGGDRLDPADLLVDVA
jgi:hypothetical protein